LPLPGPIGDPTGLGKAVGELLNRGAKAAGDLWNTLNGNRTNPPAGPAQDPNSTRGRYDPNGLNLQQVIVDGSQYSIIGEPYGAYYMVNPQAIRYSLSPEYPVNPGHRIVFSAGFPIVQVDKDTVGTGYKNVIILLDEVNPSGVVTGIHTATINRLTLDTQIYIQTRPEVGTGIPVDPDFGLGVPEPDPAFLPAPIPAPSPVPPALLPLPINPASSPADPVRDPLIQPLIPDAVPILQPVPNQPGITTTITRTVGTLPKAVPTDLTKLAPVPLPKLPTFEPALSPAGMPQTTPAPAPLTTPTDARTYGPTTVTAGGASPDLKSIASEVGRIEQKLAALLPLLTEAPPWSDLESVVDLIKKIIGEAEPTFPAGEYTMTRVCEVDDNGDPLPPLKAQWIAGTGKLQEIEAKVDALAELLQHHKDIKQPICAEPRQRMQLTGDWVTVQFHGVGD